MRNVLFRQTAVVFTAATVLAVAAGACSAGALPSRLSCEIGLRSGLAARDMSLTDGEPLSAGEIVYSAPPVGSSGLEQKNPLVAMLLSFAVPGLGEVYAGNTDRGKVFMAAEAGIWIGYASYKLQESMRIEDYKEHAELFAGVGGDPGSTYYQDIADYMRSEGNDSYNEALRAEARSLFPDDPAAQDDYFDSNAYEGDLDWEWDSESRFDEYRDLRHDASISGRNAFYLTGLAVLNRAVSGIDSAFLVRRRNAGGAGEPVARLSLTPEFAEDGSCGSRATLEFSF